jgi:hypothetical protein
VANLLLIGAAKLMPTRFLLGVIQKLQRQPDDRTS